MTKRNFSRLRRVGTAATLLALLWLCLILPQQGLRYEFPTRPGLAVAPVASPCALLDITVDPSYVPTKSSTESDVAIAAGDTTSTRPLMLGGYPVKDMIQIDPDPKPVTRHGILKRKEAARVMHIMILRHEVEGIRSAVKADKPRVADILTDALAKRGIKALLVLDQLLNEEQNADVASRLRTAIDKIKAGGG